MSTLRNVRLLQVLIYASIVSLGIWSGIATSVLASVQAFKLLNIIGLTFDLLGVLLLTFVITTPPRIKAFVVSWGGVIAVGLTGFSLIGFYIGLAVGSSLLGGKDHGLFLHFAPVTLLGIFSASFLEDTVMIPKFKVLRDNEVRLKFLGGYFLLAGLVIQIYAAFYDLWS
jgi:hypothetical protein